MSQRLCTACMKGTLVDLEVGAVCIHCRRIFKTAVNVPLPPLFELLAFASLHPFASGARVRKKFGISRLRYMVALNRAIDDPEAMKIAPVLITTLRERRDRLEAARDLLEMRRESA